MYAPIATAHAHISYMLLHACDNCSDTYFYIYMHVSITMTRALTFYMNAPIAVAHVPTNMIGLKNKSKTQLFWNIILKN